MKIASKQVSWRIPCVVPIVALALQTACSMRSTPLELRETTFHDIEERIRVGDGIFAARDYEAAELSYRAVLREIKDTIDLEREYSEPDIELVDMLIKRREMVEARVKLAELGDSLAAIEASHQHSE